jgi:ubiquitin-conjugating enzyme E2 J2
MMVTPSGRFIPETRLCLSYSDFHPETWNPMWNVSTILTGLISFMTSSEESVGTIFTADSVKRVYAKASMEFNLKNPAFRKFFESRCEDHMSAASSPVASSSDSKIASTSSSSAPSSYSTGAKHRNTRLAAQNTAKPPTKVNPPVEPAIQNANPAAAPPTTTSKRKTNTPLVILILLIVAALAIQLNRMI